MFVFSRSPGIEKNGKPNKLIKKSPKSLKEKYVMGSQERYITTVFDSKIRFAFVENIQLLIFVFLI